MDERKIQNMSQSKMLFHGPWCFHRSMPHIAYMLHPTQSIQSTYSLRYDIGLRRHFYAPLRELIINAELRIQFASLAFLLLILLQMG